MATPMIDLPEHLRIGVDVFGRGPVSRHDWKFREWACWCGKRKCKKYMPFLCRRGFHKWRPLETLLHCDRCNLWEDEL